MPEEASFVAEEESLAWLRARGLDPADFARDAFHRAMRGVRAEEKVRRLKLVRADVADLPATVRAMRDG
ncbi:MAG TPA: hypothetical protein VM889_02710 [Candidatus Thermoplasmatota archaeon]|nr:hypothetical protein [Candidatus Thermoplasmatota archaeon]